MTALRILHTVQFYHPHIGGSEEAVRRLSERLAERGHDVTVATSAHPERPHDTVINQVRVVSFPVRGNAVEGIRGDINRYKQFVLTGGFDVMMNYAAQAWPTDGAFDILKSFQGARLLVPCGYSALHDPRYRTYFEELPSVLRAYDHVLYLSETYQDKVFGDRHGVTWCSVVPNAADERERWSEPGHFRTRYGLEGKLIVLCVANHVRSKGHLELIRAFQRVQTRDAVLVIVGEPGLGRKRWTGCYYRCRLHGRLSRGRIRILPSVSRSEVVEAFASADLFALPSQIECSPLVLFEAMASATPWLSTDVGNARELPGGKVASGLSGFENALGELLRNTSERERLGEAGRGAWTERYTWEVVTDRYESLYLKLVGKQKIAS